MVDPTIKISLARPGDEYAIAECAKSAVLHSSQPVLDNAGFIVRERTVEAYRFCIDHSAYFWVARAADQIVGFLMTYELSLLTQAAGQMKYSPEIVAYLNSQAVQPAIFADQTVIHPHWRKKGLMSGMAMELLKVTPGYKQVWAAAAHAPLRNNRSIELALSFQMKLQTEIQQGEWLWGLYAITF